MNKFKSPVSQEKIVLDHLRTVGHITNMEANIVHGIRSVSRRITELQRRGYDIKKTTCHDATGQRYTKYELAGQLEVGSRVEVRRLLPPPADLVGNGCYQIGDKGTVKRLFENNTALVLFDGEDGNLYVNIPELKVID